MNIPFLVSERFRFQRVDFEFLVEAAKSISADEIEPMSVPDVYHLCGQANESARNKHRDETFAVVWVGEPLDKCCIPIPISKLRFLLFVSTNVNEIFFTAWVDGHFVTDRTSTPSSVLQPIKEFLKKNDYVCQDFNCLNVGVNGIWNANAVAAAVACSYQAWMSASHGSQQIINALQQLPTPDAFIVCRDRIQKPAYSVVSKLLVLASKTTSSSTSDVVYGVPFNRNVFVFS